jgi:hypothetical protein
VATKKASKKEVKQAAKKTQSPPLTIDEMSGGELAAIGDIIMQMVSEAAHEVTTPGATNDALANARRRVAAAYGRSDPPDGDVSEEYYQDSVARQFGFVLLFTAREPTTLRDEVERFIKALRKIQKGYPKKTPGPKGIDTKAAVEMERHGVSPEDICRKLIKGYTSMNRRDRVAARKEFFGKVKSYKRAQRKDPKKEQEGGENSKKVIFGENIPER